MRRYLVSGFRIGVALSLVLANAACVQGRYSYHELHKLDDCRSAVDRDQFVRKLVSLGFLRSSETHGPYDVFHKPEIRKLSSFAQRPFEDTSGDVAVAVCPVDSKKALLVTEEWRSCPNRKDCTKPQHKEIANAARDFGCKLESKGQHDHSLQLEDRQDWTQATCVNIVNTLKF